MEYPLELNIMASMYMEGWNGSTKQTIPFDFNEDELKVLSEEISTCTPEDDISEQIEEYLPDAFYDIYGEVVEIAESNTIFEGKVEDLLEYLENEIEIHPIDLVEQDIKKNQLDPGTPDWRLLPEKELIAQWCDLHREHLEHQKYNVIADFFEKEYSIICFFENYIDVEIRLPQAFYDDIKK